MSTKGYTYNTFHATRTTRGPRSTYHSPPRTFNKRPDVGHQWYTRQMESPARIAKWKPRTFVFPRIFVERRFAVAWNCEIHEASPAPARGYLLLSIARHASAYVNGFVSAQRTGKLCVFIFSPRVANGEAGFFSA